MSFKKESFRERTRLALNQCRSAKLVLLEIRRQTTPSRIYKRFFNLQATVRNRIYNDLITLAKRN